MTLDALLDDLADRVASRMLAKLGRSPGPEAIVYTTHKDGPHLPGKSRRWMLDNVKKMPGARKVGRDWIIDARAYNAWLVAEDTRRCLETVTRTVTRAGSSRPANDDEAELARRAGRSLRAQGQRRSK